MDLQLGSRDGRKQPGEQRFKIWLEDTPCHTAFGTDQINDIGLEPGQGNWDCCEIQDDVQGTLYVIPTRAGNMGHYIVDVAVSPECGNQSAGKHVEIRSCLLRHDISITCAHIRTEIEFETDGSVIPRAAVSPIKRS